MRDTIGWWANIGSRMPSIYCAAKALYRVITFTVSCLWIIAFASSSSAMADPAHAESNADTLHNENLNASPNPIQDSPAPLPDAENTSSAGHAALEFIEPDAPKVYGPTIAPAVRAARAMPILDWSNAPAFIPPAMVESINTATRYNNAVLSAWSAVRASNADLSSIQWQRLPSVSSGFSRYSAGAYSTYPSVIVDLPLITFGRIGSQVNRARALQFAAIATWRQKALDIAVQTEQAYFQVIGAAKKQRILEDGVREHSRLVESMSRRVAMSVSPQADLLLAHSRLEQIQGDLEAVDAQRRTALRNLAELLQGHEQVLGNAPQYDAKALDIDWTDATDQAVKYNPSREEALDQADAVKDAAAAARASIFPQVDAQYSYDPIYGSRVGLALKLQASGGLSEFSQLNAARDRFEAALAQVRDIERQIRQTIEDQLVSNRSARIQAAISADVSTTAKDVSESYERQFIAGRRSWLDVMNSVREDINAKITQITVEVTAMDTAAQLELGTGRWQPSFSEDEKK